METPNRWRGLVAALVLTGLAIGGGWHHYHVYGRRQRHTDPNLSMADE